ncbi:MAG: trigger factor family protein, partial [Evtepia sp.]
MNVKRVETEEQFTVDLVIEIEHDQFETALEKVYRKQRGSISVPGFRKGKAPRKVIEAQYGSGVFYQDAIEEIYPDACEEAIKTEDLDIVAAPRVEIMDMGPNGFTFRATMTTRPIVTLENYMGLTADKIIPTVEEDAVDKELNVFVDRAA